MTSEFPSSHSKPSPEPIRLNESDQTASRPSDTGGFGTDRDWITPDDEGTALVSIVLGDPVNLPLNGKGEPTLNLELTTTRVGTIESKPSSKTTRIMVGVTGPTVLESAHETNPDPNASGSFILIADAVDDPGRSTALVISDSGRESASGSDEPSSSHSPPPRSLRKAPARIPRIPGYDFLRLLGRGGMGEVYVAQQLNLYRLVAVKLVLIRDTQTDSQDKARFVREAEMVARIRHPNIVQIIDSGEHDGLPFYVMEYVRGGSLADRLVPPRTLQPIRETVRLIRTLAIAVEAMHRRGVIHLDLKPANILMEGDPKAPFWSCDPKVGDFGLARRFDLRCPPEDRSGTVRGSPDYIAPELATGQRDLVGPATDVYSLGVILYELLVGETPFHAATPSETIHRVVYDRFVPPRERRPELPRDLETIILKCLERSPSKRYPTAQALAEDLERVLDRRPIEARQISRAERVCRCLVAQPTLTTVSLLAILGWMLTAWLAILRWFDL